MRPALFLSFIYALLLPVPILINVGAIHPYALSRQLESSGNLHQSSSLGSLRQYVPPRALIDICASVDLGLLADTGGLLGPGLLDELLTELHLCLCLEDLDLYLDTDLNLQLLAGLLGRDALVEHLIALINTSPTKQECALPPHGHRTCNNRDVCHYDCDENYVRIGNSCACIPPFSVCNGVCGYFPSGCASPVPHHPRAEAPRVTSSAESQAACKSHGAVCGSAKRRNAPRNECLHVKTTANSCGGCIIRQPLLESTETQVVDVNCSTIPHARNVSCVEGRCIVKTCATRWVRTPQRDACVAGIEAPPRTERVKTREPIRIAVDGRDSSDTGNGFAYRKSIGTGKALRRDLPSYSAFLNPDMSQGLLAVVKIMIDLGVNYPLSPASSTSSSGLGSDINTGLLSPLAASLQAMLASQTVPALLSTIDQLLDAAKTVNATLTPCGCTTEVILDLVGQLLSATQDLQQFCQAHTIAYILSQPLPELGPSGQGTTTDSLLLAYTTVTTLLAPPPTPIASLPQGQDCYVSQIPNDSKVPIVLSLNKLLAGLGLGSIRSVTTADGLNSGTSNVVNGLLDGLHIGPHGAKKRQTVVGDVAVDQDNELALLLSALTKLVLDLGVALEVSSTRDILTSGTCVGASNTNTHTPTAEVTAAPHVPSGVDSTSIDRLIGAVAEILTSTTLSSLIPKIDIFLEASHQLQEALAGHPLVDTLIRITEAALQLRSWCLDSGFPSATNAASTPSTPALTPASVSGYPPSSTPRGDIPIIVSLNKLLAGLGLSTLKASVQVGELGNEVGGLANGLLDGLGIGPAGTGRKK